MVHMVAARFGLQQILGEVVVLLKPLLWLLSPSSGFCSKMGAPNEEPKAPELAKVSMQGSEAGEGEDRKGDDWAYATRGLTSAGAWGEGNVRSGSSAAGMPLLEDPILPF